MHRNLYYPLAFFILFLWLWQSALAAPANLIAKQGFVSLPEAGFAHSAYMLCNPTGDFGY